ncbi:MAG: bifunctional riboflavin kinase/FAD synthetase [Chitinophagales bacterium]|nr:bifunctional riboflavin kinase/FAD synthetase [Bacteroidota bacterium]MCB9256589.1 bifunctional riboflavin kinase/FAD synthetase [Chitinophagales bacterium]
MRVFKKLEELPQFKNAIISIGTFDGVHLGHQKILARLNALAKENNGESILISFHPHPRFVIPSASKDLKLLNTLEEKIALLEFYQLDNLVLAPFSHEFSQMSALDYIKDFLVKNFQPNTIVIGYDHHFGKNRSGNISLLQEQQDVFHYKIEEISKEVLEDIDISSTKIRNALLEGEIEIANQLLGHHYELNGIVIKGEQLGRKLGFPTANLQLSVDYKLIPQIGVYAVTTLVRGKAYKGMLNIGFRPTVEGTNKTIELHIFDFEEDIYGEQIQIQLVNYIRAEQKFESIENLKEQLEKDKLSALNFLM